MLQGPLAFSQEVPATASSAETSLSQDENILITPITSEDSGPRLSEDSVSPMETLEITYNPADYPMTSEETDVFLAKKAKFKERVAKIFRYFKLKETWLAKVSEEIDQQFESKKKIIMIDNVNGGTLSFNVGLGLALPQKIAAALRTTKLGGWFPESGGFFYLLGLGFGVARQVDAETHKSSWVLETFLDVERLDRSLTFIVKAGAWANLGYIREVRKASGLRKATFEVTHGGALGLVRSNETQLGIEHSAGITFPPFLGAMTVHTDTTVRYYLLRVSDHGIFEKFLASVKNFTRAARSRGLAGSAGLCSEIFQD